MDSKIKSMSSNFQNFGRERNLVSKKRKSSKYWQENRVLRWIPVSSSHSVESSATKSEPSTVLEHWSDLKEIFLQNNDYHPTPGSLQWAIKEDQPEIVRDLLQLPSIDPAANQNQALKYAVFKGKEDIVRILVLDDRVNPNAWPALDFASQKGDIAVVEALLKSPKIDPSSRKSYCIRWASHNGHDKVVAALLRDGRADPAALQDFAIRAAASNGHTRVVKHLLKDRRVRPQSVKSSALKMASGKGFIEVVKALMNDGRVNPGEDHSYALKWALINGHLNVVVELLRDRRTDPSIMGNKAICFASEKGDWKLVQNLSWDVRVQPSIHTLNQLLARAAEEGHFKVVTLLSNLKWKSK